MSGYYDSNDPCGATRRMILMQAATAGLGMDCGCRSRRHSARPCVWRPPWRPGGVNVAQNNPSVMSKPVRRPWPGKSGIYARTNEPGSGTAPAEP